MTFPQKDNAWVMNDWFVISHGKVVKVQWILFIFQILFLLNAPIAVKQSTSIIKSQLLSFV